MCILTLIGNTRCKYDRRLDKLGIHENKCSLIDSFPNTLYNYIAPTEAQHETSIYASSDLHLISAIFIVHLTRQQTTVSVAADNHGENMQEHKQLLGQNIQHLEKRKK